MELHHLIVRKNLTDWWAVSTTTRQQCIVVSFLPQYHEQNDVTIVTGSAGFDTKNGMAFFSCVWSRDLVWELNGTSLMNQNQFLLFGVMVGDDPTDKYRYLDIEIYDIFSIPY